MDFVSGRFFFERGSLKHGQPYVGQVGKEVLVYGRGIPPAEMM